MALIATQALACAAMADGDNSGVKAQFSFQFGGAMPYAGQFALGPSRLREDESARLARSTPVGIMVPTVRVGWTTQGFTLSMAGQTLVDPNLAPRSSPQLLGAQDLTGIEITGIVVGAAALTAVGVVVLTNDALKKSGQSCGEDQMCHN